MSDWLECGQMDFQMIPTRRRSLWRPWINRIRRLVDGLANVTHLVDHFMNMTRLVLADTNTRNLALFLVANVLFAFVELFYGLWSNSLSLVSDAFHMFFDAACLAGNLAASVVTKWRANEKYPFGYGRIEVLAGFANGVFLVFMAFLILSEAVDRSIHPPEVKHERLLIVSIGGFVVNLYGLYTFQHGHACGVHKHDSDVSTNMWAESGHASHKADSSPLMKSILLHIVADTMGSISVICSSFLVYFGILRADPICSIFISTLILVSVVPLLRDTVIILMHRQPPHLDQVLPYCYQKIMQIPGVYSVQEPQFWTFNAQNVVGCLKLEVSKASDPQYVLQTTHAVFGSVGVQRLYVQLDYPSA